MRTLGTSSARRCSRPSSSGPSRKARIRRFPIRTRSAPGRRVPRSPAVRIRSILCPTNRPTDASPRAAGAETRHAGRGPRIPATRKQVMGVRTWVGERPVHGRLTGSDPLLSAYGPVAGAAALCAVTGWLPRVGAISTVGAALHGPALASYRAVLAGPARHGAPPRLPILFTPSGTVAASGMALHVASPRESGPARLAAVPCGNRRERGGRATPGRGCRELARRTRGHAPAHRLCPDAGGRSDRGAGRPQWWAGRQRSGSRPAPASGSSRQPPPRG